jgi:DNA-directed RNA polymerase subunit RPC12/RpoP
MKTKKKVRSGDYVACGECGNEVLVHWDPDGLYVDCPACGNFGYLA